MKHERERDCYEAMGHHTIEDYYSCAGVETVATASYRGCDYVFDDDEASYVDCVIDAEGLKYRFDVND